MPAKNMIKSRKAISPILATLLLVVIAVAAIVVTYAWIMTYMSSAGQQAGVMLTKDAVSWPDNDTIVIYVRNTGTSDAVISAVYMGESAANLTRVGATYDPMSGVVPADGGVVKITIDYSWKSDTKYYFKVVPNTGAPIEFSEKSP
ncbi:MAG: archaellin/type IV pilin N-terminal domain-containing protein [Candidatus Bathyarchaeia archaeon]